jgi:5-methylcytosine-specific restriction protein A
MYLPRKQCTYPGCPEIVVSGRCKKHQKIKNKEKYISRDKTYQHMYNYRWNKYSAARLRSHPLCAECLKRGKTTRATVTDHVVPHKGRVEIFWDKTNHQSLCETCHNKKTYKEGAFGL